MKTLEKISPLWVGTSARDGPLPEPLVWFLALQSGRKYRMTAVGFRWGSLLLLMCTYSCVSSSTLGCLFPILLWKATFFSLNIFSRPEMIPDVVLLSLLSPCKEDLSPNLSQSFPLLVLYSYSFNSMYWVPTMCMALCCVGDMMVNKTDWSCFSNSLPFS